MLTVADELAFDEFTEEQKKLIYKKFSHTTIEAFGRDQYDKGLAKGKRRKRVSLSPHAKERVDVELKGLAFAYMGGSGELWGEFIGFKYFVEKFHPDLADYLDEANFYKWRSEYVKS
jgi:hypothetical protein